MHVLCMCSVTVAYPSMMSIHGDKIVRIRLFCENLQVLHCVIFGVSVTQKALKINNETFLFLSWRDLAYQRGLRDSAATEEASRQPLQAGQRDGTSVWRGAARNEKTQPRGKVVRFLGGAPSPVDLVCASSPLKRR